MKRCFILLLTGCLATSASWAQKAFIYNSQQKNGFVSLSVGASLPTGHFGKVTNGTQASGSGMAEVGRALSVSGGYRLAGPLGLMARFESVTHSVEPTALLGQYPQLSGDALKATATAGRNGQWQSQSVMIGPYVTVPLGRVALDVRAMAGQTWATCPETCVQGAINRIETTYRSGNRTSTVIGSSLGLTLRYRLTPVFGVQANTDYSTATFRFNNIPMETKSGHVTSNTTYNANQTLSTVSISGGLTVQFRSKNRVL